MEYDETKRRTKTTRKRKRDMVDASDERAGRLGMMIAVGEQMIEWMSPQKAEERSRRRERGAEKETERDTGKKKREGRQQEDRT